MRLFDLSRASRPSVVLSRALAGHLFAGGLALSGLAACGSDVQQPPITNKPPVVGAPTTGGTTSTGGPTVPTPPLGSQPGIIDDDCDNGGCEELPPGVAPEGCGNGTLTDDEACDDGNLASGDGCAANCLAVESGFSCAAPGMACLPIARCGDGVVAISEQCDDANRLAGDGCSDRCKYEPGMKCTGAPSVCSPAVCGDNVQEGAESCDDGNTRPFDGCSDKCAKEPNCATGGAGCTSECGDGLVLGDTEGCDDGNRIDGDGCSATCVVENGFKCEEIKPPCEMIGGECVFRVPVIFRDFTDDHPDFGEDANECKTMTTDGQTIPAMILTEGLVQNTLDAEGRPQLAGTSGQQDCADLEGGPVAGFTGIESQASFAEWFRDTAPQAISIQDLVLFDNGDGGFVNRYGENGEQFESYDASTEMWAADPGGDCPTDCHVCSWDLDKPAAQAQMCTADELTYDGNPLFFPLDELRSSGTDIGPAKVPAEYGYDAWPWEADVFPGAPDHNFYFTTEVQTWFEFTPETNATLEFTGDDDVWVFVNGVLAVDLGGIHVPSDGDVTINAQTAATYNLEPGKVYNLTVFQAERRMEGSSFRLTLSGFQPTPSDCSADCGDGIVSFGEECDDMVNDGGYGECGMGCVLSEFCGDGVVNGPEQCDNGIPGGGGQCAGCRVLTIR